MLTKNFANKKIVIVANGPRMAKAYAQEILAQADVIIALDGGADSLRALQIEPDLIAGDFDSIDKAYWGIISETKSYHGKNNILIIPTPDQNFTDLEKALKLCSQAKAIDIIQATDNRFDHSFTNVSLLAKFFNKQQTIKMMSEHENIFYVQDAHVKLQGKPGQQVSILPFTEAVIDTKGLQYDSQGYLMKLPQNSSACNRLRDDRAEIRVQGHVLITVDKAITYTYV